MTRVICMVMGHKWSRHRYPVSQGDDQPAGTFLKCLRCGKVDESEEGLPPLGAGF